MSRAAPSDSQPSAELLKLGSYCGEDAAKKPKLVKRQLPNENFTGTAKQELEETYARHRAGATPWLQARVGAASSPKQMVHETPAPRTASQSDESTAGLAQLVEQLICNQ